MTAQLSVSIVDFNCDRAKLIQTLQHLANAIRFADLSSRTELHYIDNGSASPVTEGELQALLPEGTGVSLTLNHHNQGFGSAHNQAIRHLQSRFHLVLNPDAYIAEDFLVTAMKAFDDDEKAVLLAPKGMDPAGQPLYLAKRYPSIRVLIQRALGTQTKTGSSKALYEYQDMDLETRFPILLASGCCMMVRTASLVR